MNPLNSITAVTCVLALLPFSASAIVFDLNVTDPDIVTTNMDVFYDSTLNELTASGTATNLKLPGDPNNQIFFLTAPNYILTVNIDENGELFDSGGSFGSVFIEGAIDYDGDSFPDGSVVTILTGEIFAFDGGQTITTDGQSLKFTETLEFRFEVTGGTLETNFLNAPEYTQEDFEGNDKRGGIILAQTNFQGDWTNNWENINPASADTSVALNITPIPESSLFAFSLGLACLAFANRRKR